MSGLHLNMEACSLYVHLRVSVKKEGIMMWQVYVP